MFATLAPTLTRATRRAGRHLAVGVLGLLAAAPSVAAEDDSEPVVVKTGVYLSSIDSFDIRKGSYEFTGYLWFRWQRPLEPDNRIDFVLVNGNMESIDDGEIRHHDGWYRQSHRFQARLRNAFPLHEYPFDQQTLRLVLEHRWLGTEHVVFEPDNQALPEDALASSALGPDVQVRDWSILRDRVSHESVVQTYSTDFGWLNPNKWDRASSRYVFEIPVARSLIPYVIKSVVPLVIIVLMSFCVFFINATEFQAQVSITITALLSAIAFHISQANALPKVGYLVAADIFYLLSYAVIFLTLVQVLVAHVVYHRGYHQRAEQLDRGAMVIFPVLYFVPIAYLIGYAY
jgi:hypothetical protein